MWALISMTLHAECVSVCVCLGIFFYCLFACARSGTLYSAVVLLVSIKFRFILSYSSVWYETQRQDTVSVGKPIKRKEKKRHHLEAQKQTEFTKEAKPQEPICLENYMFGEYLDSFGRNSKSISLNVWKTNKETNMIICQGSCLGSFNSDGACLSHQQLQNFITKRKRVQSQITLLELLSRL